MKPGEDETRAVEELRSEGQSSLRIKQRCGGHPCWWRYCGLRGYEKQIIHDMTRVQECAHRQG
jgi:hypothetical protein